MSYSILIKISSQKTYLPGLLKDKNFTFNMCYHITKLDKIHLNSKKLILQKVKHPSGFVSD